MSVIHSKAKVVKEKEKEIAREKAEAQQAANAKCESLFQSRGEFRTTSLRLVHFSG